MAACVMYVPNGVSTTRRTYAETGDESESWIKWRRAEKIRKIAYSVCFLRVFVTS